MGTSASSSSSDGDSPASSSTPRPASSSSSSNVLNHFPGFDQVTDLLNPQRREKTVSITGTGLDRHELHRMRANQGPLRCASRWDDMMTGLYHCSFQSTPSRIGVLIRCERSEVGEEPRDPHQNLPEERLPRWDPSHSKYDPNAPYDSFARKLGNYHPKDRTQVRSA